MSGDFACFQAAVSDQVSRLFVLISGLAHVTLPEGDDELWIMEGVNGLMIAADVVGEGHITEYPSDKPSVALQIPLEDGKMPEHRVVKKGVCDSQFDASLVGVTGSTPMSTPMELR